MGDRERLKSLLAGGQPLSDTVALAVLVEAVRARAELDTVLDRLEHRVVRPALIESLRELSTPVEIERECLALLGPADAEEVIVAWKDHLESRKKQRMRALFDFGVDEEDSLPDNAKTEPGIERTNKADVESWLSFGVVTDPESSSFDSIGATTEETIDAIEIPGYRVEQGLGAGSFSVVFAARRLSDGAPCALKLLRPEHRGSAILRRRMLREAEFSRSVRHENVVRTLDSGISERHGPWVVQELIVGETLSALLEREAPIEPQRALILVQQILEGVGAIHAHGFVHRDLKPANIMVDDRSGSERLSILDFGLARRIDPGEETHLTKAVHLVGTPMYMAPEQAENATSAGPEADLYAAGVILYVMLSAKTPFAGSAMTQIRGHRDQSPPPLAPADGLEQIAHRLLAKDPRDRFRSAEKVIGALDEISAATRTAPMGRETTRTQNVQRRPTPLTVWAGLLALALGLLGAVAILASRSDQNGRNARTAPQSEAPPPVAVVADPRSERSSRPPDAPALNTATIERTRKEPRRKKKEPSRTPKSIEVPEVEDRSPDLDRALKSRGFSRRDLDLLVDPALVLEWKRHRDSDPERANAAVEAMLKALASKSLDAEFVETKLQRTLRLLRARVESLPKPKAKEAEDGYFELVQAARAAATARDYELVSRRIDGFDRLLRR